MKNISKAYNKLKKIFAISWPFIGLALIFVWAFIYIKPMLPEDYFSLEKVKNIFKKEEVAVHPDEKYSFHYTHDALKPKTMDELMSGTKVETPWQGVSTHVSTPKELQNAIKQAKAGDSIVLEAGIYETRLYIDKDLNIEGQGTTTVIKGGDSGTAVYVENCNFNLSHLTVTDSNSAIKANKASGEIVGVLIKDNLKSGIELRNSKFTIKENIITGNGSYGVFVSADSEAVVEGNYIERNEGFQVRFENAKDIYR